MNNIYHIVPAKWFIKPDPYEPIGLKKKYWIKGPTRKSIDKVDWAPEHMDAKKYTREGSYEKWIEDF